MECDLNAKNTKKYTTVEKYKEYKKEFDEADKLLAETKKKIRRLPTQVEPLIGKYSTLELLIRVSLLQTYTLADTRPHSIGCYVKD